MLATALMLAGCTTPDPDGSPRSGETGSAGNGGSSAPPEPGQDDSASSSTPSDAGTPEPSGSLDQYGVSAAHPLAVDAGMDLLVDGGNAVDAAVGTAFAVAVVEPFASGIGGGGSAILAAPGMDATGYDYREVVAQDGNIPASGTGVPGFVAGLADIHAEHGELDWAEVLQPAIDLAEEGFPVSDFLAQRLRADFGPSSIEGLEHYHSASGEPLSAGDTLVQDELAETMTTLADQGPEAFYDGPLASELSEVDGLDADSLAAYESEEVAPVSGEFGDYEVVSAAPPLPGAALVQQLQLSEALGIAEHEPGSAGYVNRMSEAWLAAEESVHRFFGDPDFVDVPVDALTDAGQNAQRADQLTLEAEGVSANSRSANSTSGGGVSSVHSAGAQAAQQPVTAGNTTHLTVVDSEGLTVSMTNTLTSFWGGSESEHVGGFFLNNQLSRFATEESESNQPEPGRKSVSWSAPSMVLDSEQRPVLGLGSPGGHQIPNILTPVLVAWGLQGASLQEAVDTPRYHLQDGVLAVEQEPSAELTRLIDARGWSVQPTTREQAIFGSVQALEIDYDTGHLTGAADSRREADVEIADADADSGAGNGEE
ncbi:gamma-glutamyltransferase family protein [Citricoccus sp. GCM10030269]|uniref:gamma-glutamyltransferase family protein n=1 Tax=Citricoccus sp. GCM10030269 TaxID=3273388 RepID=UPI00361527BF